MKEIYDWVPWFRELAEKIADNENQYLVGKCREVLWKKGIRDSALLNHGDELIDPISFFCTLASKNTANNKKNCLSKCQIYFSTG